MAVQKKAPMQLTSPILGTDVGAESGLMQHNESELDKIVSK
jgi:hypothetical protein